MTGRPVVLVIDDSREVCAVIRAVLTTKGLDMVEANDPVSAVKALGSGTFAMVLLDMKMPHDGVAMLDYIGHSYPDLLPRVIVFLPFVDAKVCAILSKPLDLETLSRAIVTCGTPHVAVPQRMA